MFSVPQKKVEVWMLYPSFRRILMSGEDSTTRISSKVGVFIPALGHVEDSSSKVMRADSCIQLGIYPVTSSIFIKFPNTPIHIHHVAPPSLASY